MSEQENDQSRRAAGADAPSFDRRYREMLGAGLDLLDQGVTVFDADLRMVAWNETFLRLLDFPESLARQGVSFEDFIRYNAERGDYGPGDPARQIAERVARAKSFQPHVTERVRPNGQILSIRGFPLPYQGFITVYTDITGQRHSQEQIARHQAELEEHIRSRTEALTRANAELTAAIESNKAITAALQRSEQRLREITDAIPAAIAYFDNEWVYRYANKGYAEWFGWSAREVEGRRIRDVIGQDVFAIVAPWVTRALAGERVSYEYTMTGRDGTPVQARSTLVPDIADGRVIGCYVHSVDVTESRRTQAALAQAQKMEAIGQLTGGLAHDFNNMLTVVIGNLVALKENHPDDPLTENFVEPAMLAANRGAELIRRLLGFARRQPLEPRPLEVNELILGMSKLIRRSLPGTIAVSTASREPCLVAMVDAHQLENALLNLALNARDAMPNGGELRIESSQEHLDARAAADLEVPPGDYVQIAVSDNGMGMDGSTLARVFEPFFTTKQFGMGSGLGMSMVYGFVKQSGGGVRIRSRQARGTTVALLLPSVAESDQPEALPALAAPLDESGLAGKLVLLAEDDADVRTVVRMQLAELGCAVVEAENGAEAADMVENIPAIALVISDVVMPGTMDGRALARFVRRFRPELPMVLMSGYADAGEGGDPSLPLLAKPFSRDKLLAALRPLAA